MKTRAEYELPPACVPIQQRAVRLEWLTIALLGGATVLMYAVMGSSQVMKTAWVEDALSLIPPIAYLIAAKVRTRKPNERFPYGYHRAISIAFLVSSVAIFAMGSFLLIESVMKLVRAEHPTIQSMDLLGITLWQGWVMLAVLVVTGVIPVVLGRKKLPLGVELHDKALYADAHMNRADWLTALAGIVGVIGIAFGLWWADAVAAGFISLEIARDGAKHLWRVTLELMDRAPTLVDRNTTEPIASKVVQELEKLDWVRQADVRLREEGHVFTGEAFVVPVDDKELTERIRKAGELIRAIDWRIFDLVVTPVAELGPPPPGAAH